MAILTGDLINRSNITDDGTLELDSADKTLAVVGPDGLTYIIVRASLDDGIQTLRLNSDGSLTTLTGITDDGTLNLDGSGGISSHVINGNTYIYTGGSVDDGLTVFRLEAGGNLTFVENLDDDGTLQLNNPSNYASIDEVGGSTFLTIKDFDGFSVFRINADGTLTNTDNENTADNASSMLTGGGEIASLEIDGTTFLFVPAFNDAAVNVYRLDASGTATFVDVVADSDDPNYHFANTSGLATAIVAGTAYVFVGSFNGEGLSVFSVASDGQMTNVFNLADTADIAINRVSELKIFVLDGETFLGAAGFIDSGFSLFHVGDDGSLTEAETVFDDATTRLFSTRDVNIEMVNGNPFVFSTGSQDDGISSFVWGGENDVLRGTSSDDLLLGFAGNDTLNGNNGDDHLNGGIGNDIINGGGGNDIITDGASGDAAGVDIVNAGSGDDLVIVGKIGAGSYDGGTGSDTIVFTGHNGAFTGNNTLDFSQSTLTLFGAQFRNFENGGGGTGDDIIIGTSARNTLYGSAGDDMIDGGLSDDMIDYTYLSASVTVRLDHPTQTATSTVGTDTLTSIEDVRGSHFSDTIYGNHSNNLLYGNGGDDKIYGHSGSDVLVGDDGNDSLYGRGGNDNLSGGDGRDVLHGDAGDDVMNGNAGNDRLYAGSGDDILIGGTGLDLLDGSGGMDTYNGQGGNDRLYSRADGVMDTFVFDIGTGADRVFDYEEDIDRIQISSSFGYTSGQDVIDNASSVVMSGDAAGTVTITLNASGDIIQLINYGLLNAGSNLEDLADDIVIV